ncbi:TolC family protein [Helicobacter sp. MIT 01-3238]|uniref:TolC family protein n=1 Tax=Helicobacter sp. MIT 01-3238 TaxID=398627 RepID=UPI000E1EF78A|nr:TolC family protein [Helicobacter sp. MIT 01-3238]RDU55176.1 hypothetical protein CQA40_01745 [Helicobacter sp. MIT 01-3238]
MKKEQRDIALIPYPQRAFAMNTFTRNVVGGFCLCVLPLLLTLAQANPQTDKTNTKESSAKKSAKDSNLPKLDFKSVIKSYKDTSQNTSKEGSQNTLQEPLTELTKETFFDSVEARNVNLIKSKATFASLLESQKAYNSWESPYAEVEGDSTKNGYGRRELEVSALFLLKPKLPWVQTLLHKSLSLQTLQYQKTYNLYKNLAFISAKQLYLTYLITKEKYHIYIHRESNFLSQLQIAQAKLNAGSMSKKDYISFNNAYLDARLLKMRSQTQLLDLQRQLHQILGVEMGEIVLPDEIAESTDSSQIGTSGSADFGANDASGYDDYERAQKGANLSRHIEEQILSSRRDVVVKGLDFAYAQISLPKARENLNSSLYTEILDLQAKDYKTNAKISSRERFDSIEIGAGVVHAESSDGVKFRVSVPLPFTPKNTHLKRKFLALHSGALAESQITKTNLAISLDSYYEQLRNKKSYIELQKENIQNKKGLVEMGKIAYEAQKISLFEYLTYQNAYMDSLITLADAKLEYIAIQSMLEETLGEMLQ